MKSQAFAALSLVGLSYALPSSHIIEKRAYTNYTFPDTCLFNKSDVQAALQVAGNPVSRPTSGTYAPPNPYYFGNPQVPILARFPHFHALGDSYMAGPGAGDYYTSQDEGGKINGQWCYRTEGSYAYQLINNQENNEFLNLGSEDNFQFLACTGHVTKDVVQYQLPQLDHGAAGSDMKVALSIGGNDLNFGGIAKSCLFGLRFSGSCDKAKKKARNLIDNEDGKNTFQDNLFKVWSGLKSKNTGRFPFTFQTLYAAFFDDTTDVCNEIRILGGGPKLKRSLRAEINTLVRDANSAIKKHADKFIQLNPGVAGKLHMIDVDEYYEDHRLCKLGIEEKDLPGFSNDDVWFLGVYSTNNDDSDDDNENILSRQNNPRLKDIDPNTCDPEGGLSEALAVGCDLVQKNQTLDYDALADIANTPVYALIEGAKKAFHPKTIGFTETMRAILETLPRDVTSSSVVKRDIPQVTTPELAARSHVPLGPTNSTFNGTLNDVSFNLTRYPIAVATSGTVACTNQLDAVFETLGDTSVVHVGDDPPPNLVLFSHDPGAVVAADDTQAAWSNWEQAFEDLRKDVGDDAVILAARLIAPPDQTSDIIQRFTDFNDLLQDHTDQLRDTDQQRVLPVAMDMLVGSGNSTEGATMGDLTGSDYKAMLGLWLNAATYAAVDLKWIGLTTEEVEV